MSFQRLRSFVREAPVRTEGGGADFASGIVPAIISTSEIARDRARIEQAGWQFDNFRKNPVVLFAHDDGGGLFGGSRALPIARSTDERIEGDRTTAVAHFDMADEFAREVLGKVERGLINTTSVRWIPLKTRVDKMRAEDGKESNILVFERQELLEWSFVPIPADAGATVLREDGGAFDLAEYGAGDLIAVLDRAHALIERGELSDDEQAAAARLFDVIAARVQVTKPVPSHAQDEITAVLNELIGALRVTAEVVAEMRSRRAPDHRRLVAEAVAQATGRSIETIHAQLRSNE